MTDITELPRNKVFLVRRVCETCKHWAKWNAAYPEECKNEAVTGMVVADAGFTFDTKPDFGCNKWETK